MQLLTTNRLARKLGIPSQLLNIFSKSEIQLNIFRNTAPAPLTGYTHGCAALYYVYVPFHSDVAREVFRKPFSMGPLYHKTKLEKSKCIIIGGWAKCENYCTAKLYDNR